GDMNLYSYTFNDPINFIDPNGLTQQQIDDAIGWISNNEPELLNGLNPVIRESTIPGMLPGSPDGITLPGSIALIDTQGMSDSEVVGMVVHELLHIRRGFLNTLLLQTEKEHNDIYNTQAIIKMKYERQMCK